jgi:DNA-binding NtrC family response regulator
MPYSREGLPNQRTANHSASQSIVKVLVIEDNENELETLSELLQIKGYNPTKAKNAHEGLTQAKSDKYDIALIDINLPDRNGLEILQIFNKNYRHMINIIITGHSSLEAATKAMTFGADGYLEKHYNFETLEKLMTKCLEKKRRNMNRETRKHDSALMSKFYEPL